MNYNYYENMASDIENYIEENINIEEETDKEELFDRLCDELWTEDSVTGNASGSYTMNRYVAQEYVSDNMDLLAEACEEFGVDNSTVGEKLLEDDWEYFDVTIRCYLLNSVIDTVLDKLM